MNKQTLATQRIVLTISALSPCGCLLRLMDTGSLYLGIFAILLFLGIGAMPGQTKTTPK
jgi:hypothetical protein